ncbi:hypothetical protein Tco_1006467 [Tanacetum coccineum]|uniref:Uncharacterized protein n=1 Tax=Tanacetum coccineum TaxID=301880 RepID=A0ABQ5FIP3_9ASTR
MYKEYLVEFWYSTKALDNSNVSFSTPTGGIYGKVGVNTFRNAIGASIPPRLLRGSCSCQRDSKKSLLPPSLANGINIDYASIFWEDIIIKLNKKHREKVVPYTRILSLLMMYKMKEGYRYGELILYPTQVFSVNNWALKPNQPEEPPFTDHMLTICAADMPVVFKDPKTSSKAESVSEVTKPEAKPGHKKLLASKQPSVSSRDATKASFIIYFESASGCDASADSIAEADPGLSAPSTNPHVLANKTKSVEEEETSNTIKLEDLGKLVSHVQPSFKDIDSPEDDPVIVVDDSDENEETEKDEVHLTPNVETEDTSVPKSSSPRTKDKLKLLSLKLNPPFQNVEQLKEQLKQVHELEIELPGDLKEIPTKLDDFKKNVASLTSQVVKLKTLQWELPAEFLLLPAQVASVQAKLKTLDDLPSLLLNVTQALNKFTQGKKAMSSKDAEEVSTESDSDDETTHVPSSMKIEEEPKAEAARHEGEIRKEELIDLLGPDVVNRYYNDKLQYEKYYDKMLNRRAKSRITNCDILTRKDDTSEIIPKFKASDLHLGEWREVVKS